MEHIDFDVVKSANAEFKGATVRINIYKHRRQTVQYILPHDHEKLSQAELLVVDEAAGIPLQLVKSLLGPYLVFLSSTVNGYEGTGCSLSLKLLQQLEEQSRVPAKSTKGFVSGFLFEKIELSESIRYDSGDPIEIWLNALLCLDVSNAIPILSRLPPPSECDLYYVNRDTLFSYHKDSEIFLQRMMALYVASHYKNSPNDLQLMADAPAHHLFVLLGPVDESKNQLPDIMCVIQVCLEGKISRVSAMKSLNKSLKPSGDQIPWKFSEQFRDLDFPSLSGGRIVRIATHPSAMRLGYGSQAVELLIRYYEGQLTPLSDIVVEEEMQTLPIRVTEAAKNNTVTGEHSCMVLKPLNNDEVEVDGSIQWGFFSPFYKDFRKRFTSLLASTFRAMECKLAMRIIDPKINFTEQEHTTTASDIFSGLSPYDMERLKAYVDKLVDFPLILDLVPTLAHLYFQEKIPVNLSPVQASLLLCIGLQNQNISYIETQQSATPLVPQSQGQLATTDADSSNECDDSNSRKPRNNSSNKSRNNRSINSGRNNPNRNSNSRNLSKCHILWI
ncbi:hypothetical protein RIF29_25804 [Crotalaria pallida]|uniref:RNA cytidine acetyltransferase n=1 Tax=Crotalaria pallida TaxID=3830 RepID=A0AAN9HXQ9_CROPI